MSHKMQNCMIICDVMADDVIEAQEPIPISLSLIAWHYTFQYGYTPPSIDS